MEHEFKNFGRIKLDGVAIRSRKDSGGYYAFVEFEDVIGVKNALKASPILINGWQIYVEERRPNSGMSRGGTSCFREIMSEKGDLNLDSTINGLAECRDTSQVKRRMLQFASDVNETSTGNGRINSDFFISKVVDSLIGGALVENLHRHSQWNPGVLDDSSSFGNQVFDQSSEGWLANCYNDNNMDCSSDEMTDYVTLDDQIDISEFCNIAPEMETDVVKESPTRLHAKNLKVEVLTLKHQ